MDIFTIRNMTAGYGKKEILHGIDMTLEEGEFIGVLGPNGSGKSTLLKAMTGLLPAKGEILFRGRPVADYSQIDLAGSFGTVLLHTGELPSFTVREYIAQRLFARELRDAQQQNTIVNHAAKITGTENLLDANIRALSAGELQLVSIAGALAQNGKILILDEPTAHLDVKNTLECASLLEKLHASGTTVISVFHDISLALRCCTRIIGLSRGILSCSCPPEQFVAEKKADQLFSVISASAADPFTGKNHLHFAAR